MSKNLSAESVRGLACLTVILSHLALTFWPQLHEGGGPTSNLVAQIFHLPFSFFYSGTAAVYVFFVLSGYVLSHSLLKSSDIRLSTIRMVLKRYFRLALPAVVSCVISCILYQTISSPTQSLPWLNELIPGSPSLIAAVRDGAIQSFFNGHSDYNAPLWTMQKEFFGSLGIFVLCFIYRDHGRFVEIILMLIVLFVLVGQKSFATASFSIGMMMALHGRRIEPVFALPVLLIGLYFAGVHNESWSYAWTKLLPIKNPYEFFNFLAGIFIVYVALFNEQTSRALSAKATVYPNLV